MNNFLCLLLQAEKASTAAERYLLIYMIGVLVTVTALVIVFFVVFLKRKNKLLLDRVKQKQAFEEEITQAQTETQEQTLKNIGWELHDNVGQLLSFASMQLSILKMQVDSDVRDKFKDTTEALKESLSEVRALSRTLNNEVVLNIGFEKSITNELNRLKKMKFTSAELKLVGEKVEFKDRKHEIIVFRILQEFLSNSVKYSEAKNLNIILEYTVDNFRIIAKDDGKGFDMETVEKGSGLINMKSRAALIHANLDLQSQPGEGVTLTIDYPLTQIV
ncbi:MULTISPECIES: sensor histidine kinase [unclassified Algibacter]|uniref:sensor histidine kinase n=1 Tax=unclassified Algibacter TaxID=2615009 RepID=UPI00131DB5C1|nr:MULTISPECIES: histidine kinase [unclassified Algibacter]MCL5127885.1 histidine kinase [Algibacter sp. L4_22]